MLLLLQRLLLLLLLLQLQLLQLLLLLLLLLPHRRSRRRIANAISLNAAIAAGVPASRRRRSTPARDNDEVVWRCRSTTDRTTMTRHLGIISRNTLTRGRRLRRRKRRRLGVVGRCPLLS